MSIIATPNLTITAGAPPAGLGDPDPTQLASIMTGTADPTWASYVTLALGGRASGYNYDDPDTGVLCTKLTSDTVPYSGSAGFGSCYTDGGTYISHPWGDDGDEFTIAVFQGDDYRTWLVDYKIGGTLSNWRELTGSLQPGSDLAFSFSNKANTPRIAYVANGSNIVRVDTDAMELANTGNFPRAATANVSYWLGVDKNDQWFCWMSTNGSVADAWDSVNDTKISQTWAGMNEPRMDRGGNYVQLQGQPLYRIWTLGTDSQSSTYGGATTPFAHSGSGDGYMWATDWYSDGGYWRLDLSDPSSLTKVHNGRFCYDGAETHLCGAWLQGSGTDQWFTASSMGDGGWNDSMVMGHFAVGIIKGDGSDARLLCHTHSSTSTNYWSLPFANISPSGHLVIWTSHNSTNGTNTRNDYALYVAEVPRS